MKRTFAVVLCFVLFHTILAADALALAPGYARPARQAAEVAAAVQRLGAGEYSLVALRLHDKSVLQGRIAVINRDSFVVTDYDSGLNSRVFYGQVARFQGVNLASGAQVGIGGGIKARLARVAGLLIPVHRVPANRLTSSEKTLLIGIAVGVLLAIVLAKTL